jgi:hypothetical protein
VKKFVWVAAPVLGLVAMVLPALLWPPERSYDAPLFPALRNAQEHVGIKQLVLFFVAGLVLGRIDDRRPWFLGLIAVSLLPLAAIAEMVVDPTSHNLWPFEFAFYAAYGAVIASGIVVSRRLPRRERKNR